MNRTVGVGGLFLAMLLSLCFVVAGVVDAVHCLLSLVVAAMLFVVNGGCRGCRLFLFCRCCLLLFVAAAVTAGASVVFICWAGC